MSKTNINSSWRNIELNQVLSYEQPTKYQVNSTKYDNKYTTPVITPGKSFILGYTNETDGIYKDVPVIIFDDFTTASRYVNFDFKVKSSAMKILSCNSENANIKFVFYAMQILNCNHDTHKRYWISTYSKLKIPLPPLPEQNRIVEKIEELFSEIDNGVVEMKRVKNQLNIYRKAVIDETTKYEKYEMIKNCIVSLTQGWSPKCKNDFASDSNVWAVIKTSAIQKNKFDYLENKVLPDNLEPRAQHEIQPGDVLITRAGPRVRCGVTCLVKETKSKLMNCDKVYQIRVNESVIIPEFLEYILNSSDLLRAIERIKTGGNESGLNITQSRFTKLKIPLPQIYEQKKMVLEIEARLSICDKIEEIVDDSLKKAEGLRQSILKKAFSGELVK